MLQMRGGRSALRPAQGATRTPVARVAPCAGWRVPELRPVATCCSSGNHASSSSEDESSPPLHPEVANGEELWVLPPGWASGALSTRPQLPDDSWDFASDDGFVPAPANLPTDESWTFRLGREAGPWTLTDQPGIDLLSAGSGALQRLKQVYVILFGVGERETEGIYSLRAFGDDGLPNETIILFEQEEDAQRYAGLLEATMDHTPNVCSIPPRELLDFCTDQGYRCRLEPAGSLLIPPDYNVSVTDWERSMRLRDGRFAVLESEPEPAPRSQQQQQQQQQQHPMSPSSLGLTPANPHAGQSLAPAHPLASLHAGRPGMQSAGLARYSAFAEGELEDIRARLERLVSMEGSSSSSSAVGDLTAQQQQQHGGGEDCGDEPPRPPPAGHA